MICVDSKCSMLPDQRVGWCSCTCRESNEPMRATTIFARIFFARCSALQEVFFATQEYSLQDALPCKKSFLLSQAFFQLVWYKKWSFMICITTCSLIHLFMFMSMQSVIHISWSMCACLCLLFMHAVQLHISCELVCAMCGAFCVSSMCV